MTSYAPKKKLLLVVSCIIITFFTKAQSDKLSAKLHLLNLDGIYNDLSTKSTLQLINKWHHLNTYYHATIYDSLPAAYWQELFEKRYKKAIADNDSVLQLKIALPLAYVLHVQSKFEKGVHVLEYLYKNKNKFDFKMVGTILIKLEEEYRSLNNMSKVIQIRQERIERKYIKTFWEIYYSCGLYREAIEDFKLFEPIPPIATRERMSYFNRIGDLFFDAQLYDSAESYYKKGIREAEIYEQTVKKSKIKDQGNVEYWKGLFTGLVGKCMLERGQYNKAEPLIRYQLNYSKDNYRLSGLLSLSAYTVHTGRIKESKILLDSTAFYLQNTTHQKVELEYYKIKSEYFQTVHQYDSSLNYLKKYNILKEKILGAVLKNQSILLLGRLELGKRRKELIVTQKELNQTIAKTYIQRNQLYFSIVVIIIFTVGFIAFAILFKQKEKAKKEIESKSILLEQYAQINLDKSKHNEQLVKELHHRVKNNLQNIYSLLNIQKRRMQDVASTDFILSIQNRINSMAIVHESLYADENIEGINFEQYIRTLIDHIQLSFESESKPLEIFFDVENYEFSLEKIILLGLIINEIVSNVYKYAIVENGENKLWITLKMNENNFQLIIKDNGPGFELSMVKEKSLGLKLIQTMCLQLDASYYITHNDGVKHIISFNV